MWEGQVLFAQQAPGTQERYPSVEIGNCARIIGRLVLHHILYVFLLILRFVCRIVMKLYGIVFSVFKLNVLLSCVEPSRASYAIMQKKTVCVIFLILRSVGRIVMELYGIIFSVFKLNVLLSCVEPSRASCAIMQKRWCVLFSLFCDSWVEL